MNDKTRENAVGTLRISKDVLVTIASTAASEVEGVHSITASPVDFKGMLSRRALSKAVNIALNDDMADITLHLVLKYGVKIPVVSEKVQKAVKESIQSMTAITVSKINIVVEGIAYGAGEAQA
ncbi:MAG: Asp23/Gls24 family envelope stress response protein [Candidatus Fimivivens sp.]